MGHCAVSLRVSFFFHKWRKIIQTSRSDFRYLVLIKQWLSLTVSLKCYDELQLFFILFFPQNISLTQQNTMENTQYLHIQNGYFSRRILKEAAIVYEKTQNVHLIFKICNLLECCYLSICLFFNSKWLSFVKRMAKQYFVPMYPQQILNLGFAKPHINSFHEQICFGLMQ